MAALNLCSLINEKNVDVLSHSVCFRVAFRALFFNDFNNSETLIVYAVIGGTVFFLGFKALELEEALTLST